MHDQDRYLTVTTEDGQTHIYKVNKKQARKLFEEMKHDKFANPDGTRSMERMK
jgi:hypothetical protein